MRLKKSELAVLAVTVACLFFALGYSVFGSGSKTGFSVETENGGGSLKLSAEQTDGTSVITDDSQNFPVNINTADLLQLQNLLGLKASTAQNIISFRETFGNFRSTEDIIHVSGISHDIFLEIEDLICI